MRQVNCAPASLLATGLLSVTVGRAAFSNGLGAGGFFAKLPLAMVMSMQMSVTSESDPSPIPPESHLESAK